MQGASVKPHKPTKAAILQLLQQLVLEHTHVSAAAVGEASSAEPAICQPVRVSCCGAHQLEQDVMLQPCSSQLNTSNLDPCGEEDERQGGPASDHPADGVGQDSAVSVQEACSPVDCLVDNSTQVDRSLRAEALHFIEADQQSMSQHSTNWCTTQQLSRDAVVARPCLTDLMAQQRQSWTRHADKRLQGVLVLTDAQQQQVTQARSERCSCSQQDSAAAISANGHQQPDGDHMSNPQASLSQHTQQLHEGQLAEVSLEDAVSQDLRGQQEVQEAGAQVWQEQEMLWDRLAACLQEKESAQKLARLTQTLLARM